MIARAIEREYGSSVTMEYFDLSRPELREQYESVVTRVKEKYMRYPLVMIDGEVVFNGSLDYYSLSAAINKRLSALRSKAAENK